MTGGLHFVFGVVKKSNFTQFSNFLSLLRKFFGEIGTELFSGDRRKTGFAAQSSFGCNDSFRRLSSFVELVDSYLSSTLLLSIHRLKATPMYSCLSKHPCSLRFDLNTHRRALVQTTLMYHIVKASIRVSLDFCLK